MNRPGPDPIKGFGLELELRWILLRQNYDTKFPCKTFGVPKSRAILRWNFSQDRVLNILGWTKIKRIIYALTFVEIFQTQSFKQINCIYKVQVLSRMGLEQEDYSAIYLKRGKWYIC